MDHIKSAMYPVRGPRRKVEFQQVLFIDPGIEGTGWVMTDRILTNLGNVNRHGSSSPPFALVASGVHVPVRMGRQWHGRVQDVCGWFYGLLSAYSPKVVVIELPEFWMGDPKGMTSASTQSLTKLVYLVGGLGEICRTHQCGCRTPVLVAPREWKGQLPKAVVIRRIKQRMPGVKVREHMADALGMALSACGIL